MAVRARQPGFNYPIDATQAEAKAQAAKKLGDQALADLLDIPGLEQAYDLYIEAFFLDPSGSYLAQAMKIRSAIIQRNLHLARRAYYHQWLMANITKKQSSNDCLKLLAEFIGAEDHNPTSVAYVVEIIAGLAEGYYSGDSKFFQEVFKSLPETAG